MAGPRRSIRWPSPCPTRRRTWPLRRASNCSSTMATTGGSHRRSRRSSRTSSTTWASTIVRPTPPPASGSKSCSTGGGSASCSTRPTRRPGPSPTTPPTSPAVPWPTCGEPSISPSATCRSRNSKPTSSASWTIRPTAPDWPKDTSQKRFVNGFVLGGLAGAGKTAFLARQVERLLDQPGHPAPHENPNLVLLLRGQDILVRSLAEGVSLFHDIAEKLGVAVQGAPARHRREGDFSSLSELFDHLHTKWRDDKLEGRRLILVLDALNEAPLTEAVVREALDLIALAACFPWLKVVVSLRQEWLGVFAGKLEPQETDPIEAVRPFLYVVESETDPDGAAARLGRLPPPVVNMAVFDDGQSRRVYEHYQVHRRTDGLEGGEYRIPGCRTPWDSVDAMTRREVLTTPLHLHLFMEAFDGREAEPAATKPVLFEYYVNRVLEVRRGLDPAITTVVSYLLQDLSRPSAGAR